VRTSIGAFSCLNTALVVKALPKTRSGKILRGTMKRIADGLEYTMPATIEDPLVLIDVGEQLRESGLRRSGSES
jgi:propionyl-CoA synthetase